MLTKNFPFFVKLCHFIFNVFFYMQQICKLNKKNWKTKRKYLTVSSTDVKIHKIVYWSTIWAYLAYPRLRTTALEPCANCSWTQPQSCNVWLSFSFVERTWKMKHSVQHKTSVNGILYRTLGVNFTNVLCAAFTLVGHKSAKQHCWLDCLFCAFGI